MSYLKNLVYTIKTCDKNVCINFYHFYITSVTVTERVDTQYVMSYKTDEMVTGWTVYWLIQYQPKGRVRGVPASNEFGSTLVINIYNLKKIKGNAYQNSESRNC